jgi:hypothetical protein
LTHPNGLAVFCDRAMLLTGSQLADSATTFTENVTSLGGSNDDFSSLGGDSDLNTTVTIIAQLAHQESVQFSVENTVSDEL